MHYLKLSIFVFAWFIFSSFNLFSQSNLNINGGLGVGKIARDRSYSSSSSSSLWKPNFSLGLSHNLFVDDNRYISSGIYFNLANAKQTSKQEKTTLEELDKYYIDSISNMFVLKTYPLLFMSEVNLGLEFISNDKFSHEIIAAYHFKDSYSRYINGLYFYNSLGDDGEGGYFATASSKYGVSLRYNFSLIKRKKANHWRSLTFQLMLKRTELEDLSTGDGVYSENFDLSKTVIGFKFLPSFSTIVGKHFYINYYFGVGWKFMFQKKKTFHREDIDTYTGEVIINDNTEISKGISYMPTLHLGISLGYIFHKELFSP